jgi:transcriptional regulator with XRE-family HTH domain
MDSTIPPSTLLQSRLGNAPKAVADTKAGEVDQHIAQRLKILRSQGGLTLQDLASRSGVSRAMISKIERAEASATAALLHKLCTALDTSLSALLVPAPNQSNPFMRRAHRMRWQDPATGLVREIVTPRVTASKVEVVEVTLPPKTVVQFLNSSAHSPLPGTSGQMSGGYSQYIVAQTDGLRVTQSNPARVEGSAVTTIFTTGDAMHMKPSGVFSFENLLDIPCKYLVIIEHAY